MVDAVSKCNLHAAFEGLCYCELRLPHMVMVMCACMYIGVCMHVHIHM